MSQSRKSLTACEKAASLQECTTSGLRANRLATPALGAVAAGGVALCGISDVDGAIVMADSVPGFVASGATAQWDIDGNGGNDFKLAGSSQYLYGNGIFQNRIAAVGGSSSARAFATNTTAYAVGAVVGSSATTFAYFRAPQFTDGTPRNFAFQFSIGGDIHNGWGTMTTGSLNVTQAYYNDTPGGAINVGQVPEPSTAGLLALTMGAVGMRRFRKRKHSSK